MLIKNPFSDLLNNIPVIGDFLVGLQKQANGRYKNVKFPMPNQAGYQIIGKLIGADFNTINDQEIPLAGGSKFMVTDILISNMSAMPLAAGGLNFTTAPAQGGDYVAYGNVENGGQFSHSPIVGMFPTPDHFIFSIRKVNDAISQNEKGLLLIQPAPIITGGIVYFSLTQIENSTLTGDIYLIGYPIG